MESLRKRIESHPVAHLRKAISAQNIKGYSAMKKAEIVDLMLKTPERFNDIKMYAAPARMTKAQLEAGAKKTYSFKIKAKKAEKPKAEKKKAEKPKAEKKKAEKPKAEKKKAAPKKVTVKFDAKNPNPPPIIKKVKFEAKAAPLSASGSARRVKKA